MMGYYLIDNPNPYAQQYSTYRNGQLSGGVLLHTTESPKDRGAAPIANWIATQRKDYGSYHAIFDADTTILMAPDGYTVWHCAASGYNSTTMGISWACRTSDLHPDDDWTQRAFGQAARWLVAFWARNNMDVAAAAQFIAAGDTRNRPGLSTHGDAQPVDRSDAFTRHPQRAGLEALLLTKIVEANGPVPPPDPDEDDVKPVIVVDPRPGKSAWHVFGNTRYRLASQAEIDVLTYMGVQVVTGDAANPDPIVNWLRSCKDLGRPVEK
jgi:hypothetical protein